MSIESYEEKTRKIIERFCLYGVDFAACINALDTELATIVSTVTAGQVARLRTMMLANNNIVMMEMKRRKRWTNWVN